MAFNDWLAQRRRLTPERVAIEVDASGRRVTYAELDARAEALAAELWQRWGVTAGSRVALLSSNRLECLDLYFACGKLGALLVPLNYRLPPAAVHELLEDCRPQALAFEDSFAAAATSAAAAGLTAELCRVEDFGAAECAGSAWGADAGDDSRAKFPRHCAAETDVAMILYTAGTTGRAKGAMITWRQIHYNALNTIIGLQLTQDDVAFLNTPLYHTGGWHVLFTPLILLGGRLVLQSKFVPERCNERMGPAGVTILFGIPTMLRMMLDAPNFAAADLRQVRFAICGGEACPLPVIERLAARGVAVRQGYGLTEAGPNCFSLPEADAARKLGSIGFPNFFVEAQLVDDQGSVVPAGAVGQLAMRGPHVFGGYWKRPAETSAALRDGWLLTGDAMQRDDEGYYYVVGRKQEMYISGGENVYPARVERALQAHPAIAAVVVAAQPDPQWGEAGCAFVQLHPDATASDDELLAWARARLAKFECPVRWVRMDALPLNAAGKVDRLALRAAAAQPTPVPKFPPDP